jgi:hypothetical protein
MEPSTGRRRRGGSPRWVRRRSRAFARDGGARGPVRALDDVRAHASSARRRRSAPGRHDRPGRRRAAGVAPRRRDADARRAGLSEPRWRGAVHRARSEWMLRPGHRLRATPRDGQGRRSRRRVGPHARARATQRPRTCRRHRVRSDRHIRPPSPRHRQRGLRFDCRCHRLPWPGDGDHGARAADRGRDRRRSPRLRSLRRGPHRPR